MKRLRILTWSGSRVEADGRIEPTEEDQTRKQMRPVHDCAGSSFPCLVSVHFGGVPRIPLEYIRYLGTYCLPPHS